MNVQPGMGAATIHVGHRSEQAEPRDTGSKASMRAGLNMNEASWTREDSARRMASLAPKPTTKAVASSADFLPQSTSGDSYVDEAKLEQAGSETQEYANGGEAPNQAHRRRQQRGKLLNDRVFHNDLQCDGYSLDYPAQQGISQGRAASPPTWHHGCQPNRDHTRRPKDKPRIQIISNLIR